MPVPEPLLVTVRNDGALFVEVQVQLAFDAVTDVFPFPPLAPTESEVGLIVKVHPDACVTVNVWPATVKVPVRNGPVLAAMEKFVVPGPFPDAPLVIVRNDGALLVAVHVQPAVVETAVLPVVAPEPGD